METISYPSGRHSNPFHGSPQGYKEPLQAEDVFDLAADDQVETVSKDFEAHWNEEMEKPNGPSLVRCTAATHQVDSPAPCILQQVLHAFLTNEGVLHWFWSVLEPLGQEAASELPATHFPGQACPEGASHTMMQRNRDVGKSMCSSDGGARMLMTAVAGMLAHGVLAVPGGRPL